MVKSASSEVGLVRRINGQEGQKQAPFHCKRNTNVVQSTYIASSVTSEHERGLGASMVLHFQVEGIEA